MALTEKPDEKEKTKIQINIYLPPDLDDYVEDMKRIIGISKSDFIRLLLAYSRKHMSLEDIRQLVNAMMLFGEDGLEALS